MKSFGVPVVVAVNRFDTDSEEELNTVIERCHELGAECALSEVFAKAVRRIGPCRKGYFGGRKPKS